MNKKIIISILVPGLIILIRPLGMSLVQSAILATLVLTITWWVTNAVDKTIASILMLTIFSILGNTPLERIFHFLLTDNFILIVFSFIFSEGIMNSGLTQKLIEPLLLKVSSNVYKLLISILLLNLILIFIIPQSFSRIIIVGMILSQFFSRRKIEGILSEVLLFYTFSTAVTVNMMFLRGDIILNHALISIAHIEISEVLWMKAMLLPTSVFMLLSFIMFSILFRKNLVHYEYVEEKDVFMEKLTKKDYMNIIIIFSVVLLWATEFLHGISSSTIVLLGTALMAIFKLVTIKDLKSVNIGLLLFITAAFSIGAVMNNSGIAQIIFAPMSKMLPTNFGVLYALVIMTVSVAMHMVLGSNITTMSVTIPSFMLIGSGVVSPVVLVFIIYISISAHYILPFHNVIILIGNGKGLYHGNVIAKYGLPLTALLAFSIIGIYFSWWRIIEMI